jgi:hypothetical protein
MTRCRLSESPLRGTVAGLDPVAIGPTVERRGGAHYLFAPIYEVWGKPLPDEWTHLPDVGPELSTRDALR